MDFDNYLLPNDDLIDMSNPDNLPDWAKDIHTKYGLFGNRAPASEGLLSPEQMDRMLRPSKAPLPAATPNPFGVGGDFKSLPFEQGLMTPDQMESLIKNLKPTIPESDEIEQVKETINSYRRQGINDGTQLVPLYNKLVELRKAKATTGKIPEQRGDAEEPKVSADVRPSRPFGKDELMSPEQMTGLVKSFKPEPRESEEIEQLKELIASYRRQGINDAEQLVPLYNKLGELRTRQKLPSTEALPDYTPLTFGGGPTAPLGKDELMSPEQMFEMVRKRRPAVAKPEQIAKDAVQRPKDTFSDLDPYLNASRSSSDPLGFLGTAEAPIAKTVPTPSRTVSNAEVPYRPSPLMPVSEAPAIAPSMDSIPAASARAPARATKTAASEVSTTEEYSPQKEIEAAIALEKGQTLNTAQQLREAQEYANKLRMYDALMKNVNKIAAGIGGAISQTKVEVPETGDMLKDAATQYMADFKERIAQEQEDPNSAYSVGLKNFAKPLAARAGINPKVLENLSGKQLGSLIPQLREMYDTKLTAEYRNRALAESRADRAQRAADRREDQQSLIKQRAWATLPTRLENIGGPAGTRLRQRIQQAGNIYGTLGINPSDLDKMSDRQIENRLDENKKLQAVEAAIELNSMLSGSASPSQKTLEKLLMDSGYQRGMSALEFLGNQQFARNQGKYLKDIIKITSRAEKYALENLRDMEVRTLSGYRRFAEDPEIGPDFINFINKRGIDLKDLDATQVKILSEDEEAIKWAKENPTDPRSKQILKLHGL